LKAHDNKSILFGFVGGTKGLCSQNAFVVIDDMLKRYRNQGGSDLLEQSSKKIHDFQHMEEARSSCITLKLDGLVFVGGCITNTDVARLAEYFKSRKCQTTVVGVPITLEGDLKNEFVETNVGFNTVCKFSSQLIGNICLDAFSTGKEASHTTYGERGITCCFWNVLFNHIQIW
jgi:pyrophosphate--fructose-6-phosphate 1-phosphotransferase